MRSTNKRSSGQPRRGRGAKPGFKAGKPGRRTSSARSARGPKSESGSDEKSSKRPFTPYKSKREGFGDDKPFKRRSSDDRPVRERGPVSDRRRSDDDRKSFSSDRGERKSFSGGRGEKKSFSSGRGERKSFSGGRDEKKSFSSERGERKSFSGGRDEKKSFSSDRGERKSFSGGRGEKKSFSSDRGERKEFTPERRERKSFSDERGERKTFSPERRERKSFSDDRGEKKSFSGDRRERKPFASNTSEERSERKSFSDSRSEGRGEKRPYIKSAGRGDRSARPSTSRFSEGRGGRENSRSSAPESESPRKGSWFDEGKEKKPFRAESKVGGDKKWNRKETHEFYGDKKKKTFTKKIAESEDGSIRLNKFIANAGICSRREADDLISAGVISVNGEVVTEMGYKVQPDDQVKYNNSLLRGERLQYVLLNKPKDFITTTDDPDDRKTVMSLIGKACKERIYPVGRLDRNTTGVLLFTNDGDLAKKLTHPSSGIQKVYQVELDKNLKQTDFEQIEKGLTLEDGFIKVDDLVYGTEKNILGVELHSGKNRIVRRIFEHLGYEVKKLDRVIFAGLTKKDLPRGRWRFLTDLEIANLKMVTGKKAVKN